MANNLGIKKTHQMMKDRLTNYITSQYFADNKLLLNASDELLRKEGNLYQKPFIESTPSYLKVPNGIANANINSNVKDFFKDLILNKLGVFQTPFKHQVDALESFANGKNLFVATGTGSGKTECFMWPMIYKLADEAIHDKNSWKQRGVRTIVIYPMNALVSDQISRLRSIIGDRDNKFLEILNKYSPDARRPQFGMYTGRTPYSGNVLSKKTNKDIADSYRESYLVSNDLSDEQKSEKEKEINELRRVNKYPSKNIADLIEHLEANDLEHYDSFFDAELMLRYEMQHYSPDILITNYSMLDYMLIREVENNIWSETKEWLNFDEKNKLLVVIDEAHMYSGASGGEVALLIRRLFSKLGITHNKVQFIMTSASMPNNSNEDEKYIRNFAENLSGCDNSSFSYLFGEKEKIDLKDEIPFDIEKLAGLKLDSSVLDENGINKNISIFAQEIFNESCGNNPRLWLYNNILRYKPFVSLLQNCRGTASSYEDLQFKSIGELSKRGETAFENLLLLAPLAKDTNNNVLFPARIHLFFRGLNGIYACLNPKCKCNHQGDGLHLGDLYTSNTGVCPSCHSKVYELINDRRCGALFIRTFIHKDSVGTAQCICWNKPGINQRAEMIEFPLYILPDNYDLNERPKNTELAYFDYVSGKIYANEINKESCIKVLKSTSYEMNSFVFKECPNCGKKFSFISLSDFKVKGNLPFFNLSKAQFDAQPMTREPNEYIPNGGKKVLLFSDSRQSAAILARDMTKIANSESFRKAIYIAMKKLYNNMQTNEYSIKCLYPVFLEVCVEENLMFYGITNEDSNTFEKDKIQILRITERNKRLGRKTDYYKLQDDVNTPCQFYQKFLIELFCSPTVSFGNLALGYIAPLEDKLSDIIFDLNIPGLDEEEYLKIFLPFVEQTCTDSFCFDNKVTESIRKEVKYIKGNRYGFKNYEPYVNGVIKAKHFNDYKKIYESIVDEFYREEDGFYFLNLDSVKIVLTDDSKKWVRCSRCGSIHPFNIDGTCSFCGSLNIVEENPNDIRQIDYWRKPIVSEENVKSLNTEEHTAQLSFKDQKINTWAKTEDYEMRFQDINVEKPGKVPVDILSCTTTMEVGIDIGSLTAIGLRNVPPLRENYQQRAGRAGRRGSSLSTISVYAQGGPHDSYYFNSPDKIINGKLRKPWIDVNSDKIIFRHFNLIAFTKFFETTDYSLYDVGFLQFKEIFPSFKNFIKELTFDEKEINEYFIGHNPDAYKTNLIQAVEEFISRDEVDDTFFNSLYETGILPTYSFPMDVVEFNIEDDNGETKLAPQRGIDIAISEYAPGRTIVVDKKTYKSAGIYSTIRHKEQENFFKPAEPYFKEENGYYKQIFMCSNPLCGWFSTEMPEDGNCPFCGQPLSSEEEKHMLIPWGFAPLNAKDIPESEVDSEITTADDPCYSATPSEDLKATKYANLSISNRKNEEIIVLNKGIEGAGFDVCRSCGAAQLSGKKTLKENGVGAPFTNKGNRVNCNHQNVEQGVYLGASFRTDMFFTQTAINTSLITDDPLILKSASITLCEALKLSASRVLDISYNDLAIGTRTRMSNQGKYIDIYFYDSLSSGAGYSTQIEYCLDEIIEDTYEILKGNDDRDICNFWNQKVQYLFNKKLALHFLNWITESKLPDDYSENETKIICRPLMNIIFNEFSKECSVEGNYLIVDGKRYKVISAFKKKNGNDISDFDISEELPSLIETLMHK